MSRGQRSILHFSNQLEVLVKELKENLFFEGASPFDPRLVVVPHSALKGYIMHAFANDPDLQVAAGMQIVNLAGAYFKITQKKLPSSLELSLFLQHELIGMIGRFAELREYFESEAKEKRIGPFCDNLAKYFFWYLIFGKNAIGGWQEELWEKVTRRFIFPAPAKKNWDIHLFGFTHIPKSYFTFFEKLHAQFYLFSPCQIFWGDFYSEKVTNKLQLELFEDQNPFLSNWGKVGRKMLLQVEEGNLETKELYETIEPDCSLHVIQNDILNGTFSKYFADSSIECFSAPSLLREVELLKEKLEAHYLDGIEPKDIQVFAPNMNLYAPFIEAVFGEDVNIQGLTQRDVTPHARAFLKLIELPLNRFDLESVLQVLAFMEFDIPRTRKWLKAANVKWGFSKKERYRQYLNDFEEEQIGNTPEEGTFERGLNNLLLGLTGHEGVNAIDFTDAEEFDLLYTSLHSLADDLLPLYDGTKMTISTWLRYFACMIDTYVPFDFQKDLQQLAASCDHLDEEEVSFESIKRAITSLLASPSQSISPPHLQTVRFSSLTTGSVLPSKVIVLLGMQEDVFPASEEKGSLYFGEKDYRPKKNEEDRYLFLQALLSSKSQLIMSYVRDPAGKLGSSTLVQELLGVLEGGEIAHESAAEVWAENRDPLIENYVYEKVEITEPIEINIQKLFRFAKHPLRYYLQEVLNINPYIGAQKDNSEYIIDPLLKYQLVRRSLKEPIEEVFEKAKNASELPVDLLLPLAKEQVKKEVEALQFFELELKEVEIEPVQISNFILKGSLRDFTEKGLIVNAKDTLEDKVRFFPQGLLMNQLNLELLSTKEQKALIIEGDLEEYLHYFMAASKNPSPLLPLFAKHLLEGSFEDFEGAWKKTEDETFLFLRLRDPIPDLGPIYETWSPYLKSLFGSVCANI